jgi:hypothetical protein
VRSIEIGTEGPVRARCRHRYLLDIEPLPEGGIAMRSARGDHAGEGWWN